jgi:hypothetical protein
LLRVGKKTSPFLSTLDWRLSIFANMKGAAVCILLCLALVSRAFAIVVTFGLALASIVVGVITIIRSAKFNTEFSLLGVKLSTGVSVGLLGIGLLLTYFTILWWEF